MAQTQALQMRLGEDDGSTQKCQSCGGKLSVLNGTDPDKVDELGGFKETYKCSSCGGVGRFKVRWSDEKQVYNGVCGEARL